MNVLYFLRLKFKLFEVGDIHSRIFCKSFLNGSSIENYIPLEKVIFFSNNNLLMLNDKWQPIHFSKVNFGTKFAFIGNKSSNSNLDSKRI